MAGPPGKQGEKYTYADYLQWTDGQRWELIGGVAFNKHPAPNRRHQDASGELYRLIKNFLVDGGVACKVYAAPFDIRLPKKGQNDDTLDTVIQPDVSVYCDLDKLDDRGAVGAPDWVMEVLSPSTLKYDMGHKLMLYLQSGVQEYWVVDPAVSEVSVYRLNSSTNLYELPQVYGLGATVSPMLFPGLKIPLAMVFEG